MRPGLFNVQSLQQKHILFLQHYLIIVHVIRALFCTTLQKLEVKMRELRQTMAIRRQENNPFIGMFRIKEQ